MTESPLFIIGTERSGSNLLRLILNTHPRIAIPHPPHIVHYFAPLESSYGDLERSDRAFRSFVDDILGFIRLHIYPWEIKIDGERVYREARPRDAFGVTVALYEQYREQAGKARWGCKSTFMIDHADRVLVRFPQARLLYLTRDPRDVAASSRKSIFNPYHPYFTAQLWRRQQQTGLALLRRLGPETILHVRYEDLLSDPAVTVARICDFLGETYYEQMLRYFDTPEAKKSASLSQSWENTGRGILQGNCGKYRTELSEAEVRLVEGQTHEEMEQLGYVPDYPPSPAPPSRLQVIGYHLLDPWWQLRTECRSMVSDRNHWRRWGRALAVVYLRARRRPRNPARGTYP